MISVNQKIICTPYAGGTGLKQKVSSGFVTVLQKSSLECLTVLVDGKLQDGTEVKKGSKIYFKEEDLCNFGWAKTVLESKEIEGKFIIAPSEFAVCIK